MIKIELQEKLKLHKLWLENKEGERLDLSETDLSCVDLIDADLSHSSLIRVDLRYANFSHVNLTGADLNGTNLIGANFSRVNLKDAYLNHVNLTGANLSGAHFGNNKLNKCIGNGKEIKTIQTNRYWVVYTKDIMQIGCENHTIDKWFQFSDDRISKMDDDALEWWEVWKPILKQIIEEENGDKRTNQRTPWNAIQPSCAS